MSNISNSIRGLKSLFIKPVTKPTGASIMKQLELAANKGHHIGGPMADSSVYEKFAQAISPFAEEEVRFLGSGVEHNVFDIGGGKVAKIGYGKPATFPDLPEVLKPMLSIDLGKHSAYIMRKAETKGITTEHVTQMARKLYDKGWNFDAHAGNLGIVNGETKIIDHGLLHRNTMKIPDAAERARVSAENNRMMSIFAKGRARRDLHASMQQGNTQAGAQHVSSSPSSVRGSRRMSSQL